MIISSRIFLLFKWSLLLLGSNSDKSSVAKLSAKNSEGMKFESKLLMYVGGGFGGLVLFMVIGIFIRGRLNKRNRDRFLRKPYEEN